MHVFHVRLPIHNWLKLQLAEAHHHPACKQTVTPLQAHTLCPQTSLPFALGMYRNRMPSLPRMKPKPPCRDTFDVTRENLYKLSYPAPLLTGFPSTGPGEGHRSPCVRGSCCGNQAASLRRWTHCCTARRAGTVRAACSCRLGSCMQAHACTAQACSEAGP